jgi:hypothetical protein
MKWCSYAGARYLRSFSAIPVSETIPPVPKDPSKASSSGNGKEANGKEANGKEASAGDSSQSMNGKNGHGKDANGKDANGKDGGEAGAGNSKGIEKESRLPLLVPRFR